MWDRAEVQALLLGKMIRYRVEVDTGARIDGAVGAKDGHDVEVARLLREEDRRRPESLNRYEFECSRRVADV